MFLFISLENRILRKVWLRKEETKISLKHKKIDAFGLKVFAENKTLKEIELPETLKRIDYECFCNCSNLEKVVIHDGLKSIDCSSFSNCTSLKEIELPDSVEHIGDRAFDSCTGLEKIKLSSATKEILSFTFKDCLSLKTIIIPEGVIKIQNTAFFGCKNLKHIELPSTLISAFNNFKSCQNLEKIVIKDWRILLNGGENGVNFDIPNSLKYVYINKKSKQMIISNKNENLEGYEKLTINNLKDKVDERYEWITYILYNYLFGDIEKNKIMKNIYDQITRYNLNQNNYRLIQKDLVNSKNFEQMLKYISKKILDKETRMVMPFLEYELFKFSYALGIFSENEVERQKASEFVKNVFEKKILNIYEVNKYFENMNINGFNKGFANFIMRKGNIEKLVELEKVSTGYIADVYNYFNDIREYGRSNKGSQRYRKVTVDMCKEFFLTAKFNGIDSSNIDIAETIHPYTHSQETFQKAIEIRKQYQKMRRKKKINDHLLIQELKEVRRKIIKDTSETLSNLNEVSNNEFTYEYLSKFDPRNFVLGKYCSCCSHLEGTGIGIVKASILHPDCQNLVIKNSNGKIIAKSTLYINRKQGYGIFNNVEVNTEITSLDEKQKIYEKYIKAVADFANKYNELNKDKPIKQINVGMTSNDLNMIIKQNNQSAIRLLKGINFTTYGGHPGDWQHEQYVVWKKK